MTHVIYALFQAEDAAQAAVQDIEHAPFGQCVCHVVLHRDHLNPGDLRQSETDTRHGAIIGLVAGTVGGALFGAILGALRFFPIGIWAMAAFLGALGAIVGVLGPLLYGTGSTNQQLQKLSQALTQGRVLLTAEVEGMLAEAQVAQIFSKHGAIETSRAAI
jgi:uncharacterized membrane protein